MKNKLNILILAIAVLGITFGSCRFNLEGSVKLDENGGPGEDTKEAKTISPSVDWNHYASKSIKVTNDSGRHLIAFKGIISADTLIGGVPAHATAHGLNASSALFSKTEDFALRFLTAVDYEKHKDNLMAVRDTPFSSVYAFYNNEGDNDLVYTVSSFSGGNGMLKLTNSTALNCELRKNSPNGEVIGYVGAYTSHTTLYLTPGEYAIFPVFKKYVSTKNEILTVVPKFPGQTRPYYADKTIRPNEQVSWDVGDAAGTDPIANLELSCGGFYLRIYNNNLGTNVHLKNGDHEFADSLGFTGIDSGSSRTFFVPFPINPDKSYPDTHILSTLKLGPSQGFKLIDSFEFKKDKVYAISVGGTNAGNVEIGNIILESDIDVRKLFFEN